MVRKHDTEKLTTAEQAMERAMTRERKKARVVFAVMLFGLICVMLGLFVRFVPFASASEDDTVIVEEETEGMGEEFPMVSPDEYAYYMDDGMDESLEKVKEEFYEVTEDEVVSRVSELASNPEGSEDLGSDSDRQDEPDGQDAMESPYVRGEMIVTMAIGTTDDDVQKLMSDTGCYVIDTLVKGDEWSGPVLLLSTGNFEDNDSAKVAILADTKVISCSPNYISALQTDDGSDMAASQSSPYPSSPNDPHNQIRWEYDQLQFEEAWKYQQTNGALTVAVMDADFNVNHADLKNVIVSPYNVGTDSNEVPSLPQDASRCTLSGGDHGTFIAGIIGAQANNGIGLAGLSYNACIMPVSLQQEDSAGNRVIKQASILKGLDYICQHAQDQDHPPVRVVNMSLGVSWNGPWTNEQESVYPYQATLARLADQGILVVASAGNDGQSETQTLPACLSEICPNLIGVMSVEQDGQGNMTRCDFSNYSPAGTPKDKLYYQVGAPGRKILSCVSYDKQKNLVDTAYAYHSGTSMSAPMVAGLASLLFAANPSLSPVQARQIICETATDLGPEGVDPEYGYGEINPVEALKRVTTKKTELIENIKVKVNGQSLTKFDPLKTGRIMTVTHIPPVEQGHTPTFQWTYPTAELELQETHTGKTAQNDGEKRQLDDGRYVIDYVDQYRHTFLKKGTNETVAVYGFKYVMHVLVSAPESSSAPSDASATSTDSSSESADSEPQSADSEPQSSGSETQPTSDSSSESATGSATDQPSSDSASDSDSATNSATSQSPSNQSSDTASNPSSSSAQGSPSDTASGSSADSSSKTATEMGASQQGAQSGNVYASLSSLEIWIGGTRYKTFSYDKTEYTISFETSSPLPAAPEVKNVPTDQGWKLDTIVSASAGDENGSMKHTVTLSHKETGATRQYVFLYKRSVPVQSEIQVPEGMTVQEATSARSIAQTGSTTTGRAQANLVQTGDAVLIVGGTIITLGAAAWLVAYRRRTAA